MDIAGKIRTFLTKLQGMPENKKKIVLWTIVGVLAIIMGSFWMSGVIKGFSKMGEGIQNVKVPEIDLSDISNSTLNK